MSLSKRAVHRYLKKLGYEYAVKKKKWLSWKDRKAWIQCCELRQHCTLQGWRNDESTFYVLKRKNKLKIWRTEDERLLSDCIQQMNTEDGGKVGISGAEMTTAQSFAGTMNGTLYCDVLQQELTQSMGKLSNKSA